MRIVADENIPLVRDILSGFGQVDVFPANRIDAFAVRTADVLLGRSVTEVGPALLDEAATRFVGSATTGTDHVDAGYLAGRGIFFAHAPGSNAESVVEYVVAALVCLADRLDRPLEGLTVGVVGFGNIGSRLAPRLAAMDMRVLVNDPPLERADLRFSRPFEPVPLPELLSRADVVTLHVPLTREGDHPTSGLIGAAEAGRMKEGAWLVNTSRGGVVDEAPVVHNRRAGRLGALVLDVWENEPHVSDASLRHADLATPHIAGYSLEGKSRGTWMLYESLCDWAGREPADEVRRLLLPETDLVLESPAANLREMSWRRELIRQLYDPFADDRRMRDMLALAAAERSAEFHRQRRDYPTRRSWNLFVLDGRDLTERRAQFVEHVARVRVAG